MLYGKLYSSLKLLFLSCSECATASKPAKFVGRPIIDFEEVSERTKTRCSVEAVEVANANMNIEKLCIAPREQLKLAGRPQDTQVLKAIQKPEEDRSMMTGPVTYMDDEALALLFDCRLSKEDYTTPHKGACEQRANLYPFYHNALLAKK